MKFIVVVHQHETRMMVVEAESDMQVIEKVSAGAYESMEPDDVTVQTWAHVALLDDNVGMLVRHSGLS